MKRLCLAITVTLWAVFVVTACGETEPEGTTPTTPVQIASSETTTSRASKPGGSILRDLVSVSAPDGPDDVKSRNDNLSPSSEPEQAVNTATPELEGALTEGQQVPGNGGTRKSGPASQKWSQNFTYYSESFDQFLHVESGVVVAGPNTLQYAYDTDTGDPIWEYRGIQGPRPLIANGVVYFPAHKSALRNIDGDHVWGNSAGHGVHAVELETANLLWTYEAADQVLGIFGGADGVAYVAHGNNKGDTDMVALDTITGNELWRSEGYSGWHLGRSGISGRGVVVSSQALYFLGDSQGIIALDAKSGSQLWRNENFKSGDFTVADELVYVDGDANSLGNSNPSALNADNGDLLWEYEPANATITSDGIANGVVYLTLRGSGLKTTYAIEALDGTTGTQIWRYDDHDGGEYAGAADGVAFFYVNGGLQAIDAATGDLLWYKPSTRILPMNGLIQDDVLYVQAKFCENDANPGTSFTSIIALEAKSGDQLWHYCGIGSGPGVIVVNDEEAYAFIGARRYYRHSRKRPVTILYGIQLP